MKGSELSLREAPSHGVAHPCGAHSGVGGVDDANQSSGMPWQCQAVPEVQVV